MFENIQQIGQIATWIMAVVGLATYIWNVVHGQQKANKENIEKLQKQFEESEREYDKKFEESAREYDKKLNASAREHEKEMDELKQNYQKSLDDYQSRTTEMISLMSGQYLDLEHRVQQNENSLKEQEQLNSMILKSLATLMLHEADGGRDDQLREGAKEINDLFYRKSGHI